MFQLTANDFVLTLAGIVLFLGVISFIVGLFILAGYCIVCAFYRCVLFGI